MTQAFAGVDVGLTGGIAVIIPGSPTPALFEMPTEMKPSTKKGGRDRRVIRAKQLLGIFREMKRGYPDLFVMVESPQLRPAMAKGDHVCPRCGKEHQFVNQGMASGAMFIGQGQLLRGMLLALGIAHEWVHPRTWKTDVFHGRGGDDKTMSRKMAAAIFPALKSKFEIASTHGLAEALLLADYGRRTRNSWKETLETLR